MARLRVCNDKEHAQDYKNLHREGKVDGFFGQIRAVMFDNEVTTCKKCGEHNSTKCNRFIHVREDSEFENLHVSNCYGNHAIADKP